MDIEAQMKKAQEEREHAVTEHFATCVRICKKLEIPLEHGLHLINLALNEDPKVKGAWSGIVRGKPQIEHGPTTRSPLRLMSDKPIKKTDPKTGNPTVVHARPQVVAMRVEEIEILGRPEDWFVADIRVGNRSQFPQSGPPLHGRHFMPGGTCYRFVTETLQTAMDFDMVVHYVGENPEGAIFEALAMGTQARF
jgi:hypothetical protein